MTRPFRNDGWIMNASNLNKKCLNKMSFVISYKSWSALPASLVQVPPLTSLTSTIWSFSLPEAVLWSSASVSVWLFPPLSISRKFCSLFWFPAFSSSSLRSLRLRFFHLKKTIHLDFLVDPNSMTICQFKPRVNIRSDVSCFFLTLCSLQHWLGGTRELWLAAGVTTLRLSYRAESI